MSTRVHHSFTILAILQLSSACSSKDPCDENPDLIQCFNGSSESETGDGDGDQPTGYCAPFENPELEGQSYECQGIGNGWLDLSVYPLGPQDPECLNWGGPRPEQPTTDDCVPIDITSLPNDAPSPGACCVDEAQPAHITQQCTADCGYAACTLAIAKLRDAALALPTEGPEGIVRLDLFYFANVLEAPTSLENCAEEVSDAGGELTLVQLGEGASGNELLGHVQSATLSLSCAIDDDEPYVLVGEACDAPPNLPIVEDESNLGGIAAIGAVAISGPAGNTSASLHDIAFAFTELLSRSGAVDVRLDSFTAQASTVSHGSFVIGDPSLRLVEPAMGRLSGESIMFPPASLRMEIMASITVGGEPMFDGKPLAGEYLNTEWATATRSLDGKFAFVEAVFEAGGYRFVLNTEAGSFQLR